MTTRCRLVIAIAAFVLAISSSAHAGAELAVYKGAGCDGVRRVPAFEAWLGRRVDRVVDFLDGKNWAAMTGSAKWIGQCWQKAGYRLALSVPMLTTDKSATLADGAKGDLDHHFREIARILVATGHADSILRVGWEFNGSWYPWSAANDPDSFVAFWRRIVVTMRAAPGNRFRFDWNPTIGTTKIDPERVYPGDDVVDIIGLDVYNQSWHPRRNDPDVRWDEKVNGAHGLKWHRDFARARGKPRSFPEWGTGTRKDGHGFGDDPAFVNNMHDWISAADVAYHGYWDFRAPDFNAELSTGQLPAAASRFKELFAGNR
jgi:Glycosyl hydrolase family 26